MHDVDKQVFHWINGWSDAWQGFYVFFSEASKTTVGRLLILSFAVVMLAASRTTRRTIVQALIAWPIANGLTDILKGSFKWQRPCVELSDAILSVTKLTSYGTASAHSANMAAVATVLVWRLGWWGVPWILIALATGISRIYVGVHFPSQVLLGWFCGVVTGTVVVKAWDAIESKRSAVRTDGDQEPSPKS